jgi:hypothetical protein
MAPDTADHAPQGEMTSTVEGRATKHSSSGLSPFGAFMPMASSSLGLWSAYYFSRKPGAGITEDIFFFSYCLTIFTNLQFPPIEFFPQNLQESVIHGGGTLEDVKGCREAHTVHNFCVIWALFISTVGICIASHC